MSLLDSSEQEKPQSSDWADMLEDLLRLVFIYLPLSAENDCEMKLVCRHWWKTASDLGPTLLNVHSGVLIDKHQQLWSRCPNVEVLGLYDHSMDMMEREAVFGCLGIFRPPCSADVWARPADENLKLKAALSSLCKTSFEGLGDTFPADAGQKIATAIRASKSLKVVMIGGTSLEQQSADLCGALEGNETVHTFGLLGVPLEIDHASRLGAALHLNTALKTLMLWRTRIGARGAAVLGKALEKNTSLLCLDLFRNRLGPEGARSIAEALKKNTTLVSLNLGCNDIGDEGTVAVAATLRVNHKLHTVNLQRNNISKPGADALLAALACNRSVHILRVSLKEIGVDSSEKVKEHIRIRRRIQSPKKL
eukprot:TRINITY_DN1050_c0_g1::TRINITY_DN1050_c0_g1_i1::g.30015::m.30015 TRINITY_DN1050_c0_g1::TRINITY_DN1050_c0_g1_i1::g.30015  ORF type:complete len:365 (+),score=34.45,sp/Q7RTR2/NLRC3_HUMAN/44.00/1e-18,sp/Q7RTR2/NLRC3_HUMAN/31.44/9e-18,sp/Q7RTR2/NLRC3_HUMAN/31.33/3e-16,sp/Q7RTR2/NLRC3_HUMAN/28.10/6e-11,sp/Q7RTR2/NLRC3_HUMAN/30.16/6e-10,sp/Q7RTR2/NLRC3_HUMAN/40.78/1e-08,LRR_6/PF13516.1/7.8e+03,LRR_6/PF13516.1/7.8e+03,LRR_6/PF13516.1/34,LRR_6/PF13516.1/1.8,LRR_6/PF13516.1/0.0014,LRR_6/PF13516.1/0.28,LRR